MAKIKSTPTLSVLFLASLMWSLLSISNGATVKQENEAEGETELPSTVSVVLLGRRGAGITSTVRQLLGPKVTIHPAQEAVASTDILEYTIRLHYPGKNAPVYLKLVDVPGLEVSDNLEHDAEILSTMKSYLHDKGLPTFFLVVYRLDDKEIAQPDSQFRQLLKRFERFQQALFRTTTDNTIFLLTRLLSEPTEVQQNPNARIEEFRRVIQESISLQSPVEIVVGDNKPDPSTVQMESGFIKLPNGELYPKNIWEKLLQVADRSVATEHSKDLVKPTLSTMTELRESAEFHTQEIVAHATDEDTFESDLEAFEYLLRQSNVDLPKNDIQLFLQTSYENQDAPTQIASCAQLLALQLCIRNLHLESVEQLPQTQTGIVELFQQEAEGVMTFKYSLFYLKKALGLDVPEYPARNLVTGYGYDVISDHLIRKSPFQRNSSKRPSSSLGYLFPDYMECEKLTAVDEVVLANSTETDDAYQEERLKYLMLPDRNDIVLSQLKGTSKAFLNLRPSESGKLVAGKEVRILECKISVDNDSIAIIDESFISAVNNLPLLNTTNENSVAVWKLLFHQYGTHIVVKSFGGGCYEGTLLLPQGENAMQLNRDNIGDTLTRIVNFGDLAAQTKDDTKALVYKFHVDNELDNRATHLNLVNEPVKSRILNNWKHNLNLNFEMLTTELELVPLSQLVSIVNSEKATDAVEATKLLLQGKLTATSQPGVAATDESNDKATRIAKARSQAEALQLANLDKTIKKIEQLHNFLEGTRSG